jgi:hypothetical protein
VISRGNSLHVACDALGPVRPQITNKDLECPITSAARLPAARSAPSSPYDRLVDEA